MKGGVDAVNITLGLNTKHRVKTVRKKLLLNDSEHYESDSIFIEPETYDIPNILTAETSSTI